MCGACGSGRVRAPWEEQVGEPGPRGPARRAAVLTRLLAARRWRVAAWAGGYTVTGPCGALPPATCVDDVVARAIGPHPGPGWYDDRIPALDLDLAEAVVRASVAAALVGAGGAVVLRGPVRAPSTVTAHHAVPVRIVPRDRPGWSVAGFAGAADG